MEQARLERMLILMKKLTDNEQYTVSDLARSLNTTTRSIYRYLETFQNAGFSVVKKSPGIYCLTTVGRKFADFSRLVMFTEEEAFIVSNLIGQLDNSSSLKKGLMRKLSAVANTVGIAEFVTNRATSKQVELLDEAIRGQKSVILHDYESGSSHTIRDRHVEPFKFTVNLADVLAYEPESGEVKTFKISRIGSVEVLDEGWQNPHRHLCEVQDAFRMTGGEIYHVVLEMSILAKNLLLEEYPVAARDLQRNSSGRWILDTRVRSLVGIGRFVVGLADEIRILKGPELIQYIIGYRAKLDMLASCVEPH